MRPYNPTHILISKRADVQRIFKQFVLWAAVRGVIVTSYLIRLILYTYIKLVRREPTKDLLSYRVFSRPEVFSLGQDTS